MIALLVSPDYASHYLPLSAIGAELRARGAEVVVATGPGLRDRVIADGFGHRELTLGPGSNTGLIRARDQDDAEAEQLTAFFAATREGPIATLRHQAAHRLNDLLWRPEAVTRRLRAIIDELDPGMILSDQLAYGASLALRAIGRPFATLLPGHPSALPAPGELFGSPAAFPDVLGVAPGEAAALRELCGEVSEQFASGFRSALHRLAPSARSPIDPFAASSPWLTLVNYPHELTRTPDRDRVRFIGACVRSESLDPALAAEVAALPRPRVYASLGSFLSTRDDVLTRIAAAFGGGSGSLILASGVADPQLFGPPRANLLVRPYLPQVALLPFCDLAICHGGNNTVTEALEAGLPVLVGPLSSDQFAGADDLLQAGLGDVFDPNRAAPGELARSAVALLAGPARVRAEALGRTLRASPGRVIAADALSTMPSSPRG